MLARQWIVNSCRMVQAQRLAVSLEARKAALLSLNQRSFMNSTVAFAKIDKGAPQIKKKVKMTDKGACSSFLLCPWPFCRAILNRE